MYCSGSSHSSCCTLLIPAAAVVRHSQLSTRDTTILDTDIGLSNRRKIRPKNALRTKDPTELFIFATIYLQP